MSWRGEQRSIGGPAASGRGGARSTWWIVLALVWIAAAVYVRHGLDRGWFPHDEGTLAQSAERVLGGELPHRDFDEVYTGGLSYLNAAAFRTFGTNLLSLRLLLFCVFLVWVPALYYLATRFAEPALAGVVVALGVAWSLPTYSAAVPSWYNLFCATFGTAALCRHLETGRRRWLIAAGVAGGVSCVIKIVGLYYVAGVLLFLVFRERVLLADSPGRPAGRWRPYPFALGAALLCFVAGLVWLLRERLAVPEVVHFLAPGVALAAFVFQESRAAHESGWTRFAGFARLAGPFALGFVVPIGVFLIPYVHSGSLAPLASGLFLAPVRRFAFAARSLPGVLTLFGALPVALLLGLIPLPRFPGERVGTAILVLALTVFLVLSKHAVWYSSRPLVPLAVLVGIWRLQRGAPPLSPLRRQQLLLVLSVTALSSLVQFPFAAPGYFFYVAPLAAIAVMALVRSEPGAPRAVPGAVLALYLLFAVVDTHPNREPMERLALERGGIVVPRRDRARYESLVRVLQTHASGGYIYAAPDCPEVYFLAGLGNPTRTIFEFLGESAERTAGVLRALDDHHVTAVAIDLRPPFSAPLAAALIDSLGARYPAQESLDQFVVRWRP